jgi:hypothetical protein
VNPRSGASERVYRWLLRLYPVAFRTRFGDEMVQLFGDLMRDAQRRQVPARSARMWLRTLWDLVITAPAEYRRERTVAHSLSAPPNIAIRALGIVGIVGGLMILAAWIPNLPWTHDLFNLRLVVFNLGAIAVIIAVHRRQSAVSRRLSLAAAVSAIAANSWYLVMIILSVGRPVFPEPDPEFRLIFFYAATALWLADGLFGLVALRLGAVTRWGAFALTLGSLAILGIDRLGLVSAPGTNPNIINTVALAGVALSGVGWVLMGLDVVTRRHPIPVPPLQE